METTDTPKAGTVVARTSRALLVIISAVGMVLALSVPALIGTVATPGVAAAATTSLTWSAPKSVDTSLEQFPFASISCTAPDFCVAVGYGFAITYNGSDWSTAAPIDDNCSLSASPGYS